MFIDDFMRGARQFGGVNGARFADGISIAVRFKIDNVAQYVYNSIERVEGAQDDEFKVFRMKVHEHFPNIAPLAPMMWFEYNGLSIGKESSKDCGVLLTTIYNPALGVKPEGSEGVDFPDDLGWILRADTYGRHHDRLHVCRMAHLLSVHKDGQLRQMTSILNNSEMPEEAEAGRDYDLYIENVIALTAICFAHCKGAEVKEHQPSRQVRRHAERKGEPVYTHRTIDIGPASRVLHDEGNVSQNGIAKALHICRGHFAHYTADKPLFGKYVGTVYKPMHLRGKAESGIVEKDYNVHAGAK